MFRISRCLIVAGLSAALLLPNTSQAQDDKLENLKQKMGQLFGQGEYKEATFLGRLALTVAIDKFGPKHPEVAFILNNLAVLHEKQKEFSISEKLHKRALAIRRLAYGANHQRVGETLHNLAILYENQDRNDEAILHFERAIEVRENVLGADHPGVAEWVNDLARLYKNMGRFDDAVSMLKRQLAIHEKKFGPVHPAVDQSLDKLAMMYWRQKQYDKADAVLKRSLAIKENILDRKDPRLRATINRIGALYQRQGRNSEAAEMYRRILEITEEILGPDHQDLREPLFNLSVLYRELLRYREAEALDKRNLSIAEKTLDPADPNLGMALNQLAGLYSLQGRYDEAELLYKRALKIVEDGLPPDHPTLGFMLNNVGGLYASSSRLLEAQKYWLRALEVYEKAHGRNHPVIGSVLGNLASVLRTQGRLSEAEAHFKRALEIATRVYGPNDAELVTPLENLADVYQKQDRYLDAKPLFDRAFEISKSTSGHDKWRFVIALINRASRLFKAQGPTDEGEALQKRAVAIAEETLGRDHHITGIALNGLGVFYSQKGEFDKAETLLKRAAFVRTRVFGSKHWRTGRAFAELAAMHFRKRDWPQATRYYRRTAKLMQLRGQNDAKTRSGGLTGNKKSSATQARRQILSSFVKAGHRASLQDDSVGLSSELFQIAQRIERSEAAESLAQMAVRHAGSNPKLSPLIRERQTMIDEWQRRDAARSAKTAQQRDKKVEQENVARLTVLDRRIATIDQRLAADFPNFSSLANPKALSISKVQAQLKPDEALVLFVDVDEWVKTPEETFIWVVTKTSHKWVRSGLGPKALKDHVDALRCGLDEAGAWQGSRCKDLLGVTFDRKSGEFLPFRLARAYSLYQALFGKVEKLINGKNLLIVPSGPLTQLPFQVLVTKKPEQDEPTREAFNRASWMVQHHAITILPSVASLKALRTQAKTSKAQKPFVGFGNPILDGDVDSAKVARSITGCAEAGTVKTTQLRSTRSAVMPMASGQGHVDVGQIRSQFALPETADELCDVARNAGAQLEDIYLGNRATESNIKSLSTSGKLASYKVLHFATHGALAGELDGSSEPGLIFSPPSTATETDDGYLSASEVAALKLDADWVILSACNTAGGQTKNAEALSGLAKAFFYSGARSLLVSHWYVHSQATVALITKAFDALRNDPRTGRAQALRQAMLSLIADDGYMWHPAYWSPFVVVGEGA